MITDTIEKNQAKQLSNLSQKNNEVEILTNVGDSQDTTNPKDTTESPNKMLVQVHDSNENCDSSMKILVQGEKLSKEIIEINNGSEKTELPEEKSKSTKELIIEDEIKNVAVPKESSNYSTEESDNKMESPEMDISKVKAKSASEETSKEDEDASKMETFRKKIFDKEDNSDKFKETCTVSEEKSNINMDKVYKMDIHEEKSGSDAESPKNKAKICRTPKAEKIITEKQEAENRKLSNLDISNKTALFDSPLVIEGKRQRHSVERLNISDKPNIAKHGRPDISTGSGIKLVDIEFVAEMISKSKPDNLKPLHRLIFGRAGTSHEIRRNLRQFSGFAFDENSVEFARKKTLVEKWTADDIRSVAGILGTYKRTNKEMTIKNVLDYLLEPADLGKKASKIRSAKPSGKTSAKRGRKSSKIGPKDRQVDEDEGEENAAEERGAPLAKKPRSAPKKTSNDQPTDDQLTCSIKKLLKVVDLEKVTMKEMCRMVYDKFPDANLVVRKDFIKSQIKMLISTSG